ncbi:hypothetical protein FB566_2988 [Stackebrandtia endophytica]|uniref:Uncharacterized protein n=1 Tax=Stackebrandtia endophytica TaxID=1496996 RepID=A0A543AXX1_9ACTN|nr:hypothetical protein [Stackebrandtia endophytica]TQL77429.1 hypothetical protein FB566_2988 [Stackebrandtia endophytica]
MILLKRRKPKNRAQLIRGELAEGFGHFRSATSHAANGAAERIAPRIDSALTIVGLRKKRRARWPWVAGAVAAGAAAGVAGAILLRRKREPIDDLFADDPRTAALGYPEATIHERTEEFANAVK